MTMVEGRSARAGVQGRSRGVVVVKVVGVEGT